MKFSLSWISEHIDFIPDITVEIIGNSLTNLGLEVESIHNPADKLKDFIIAEIIEVSFTDLGKPWNVKHMPKHKI